MFRMCKVMGGRSVNIVDVDSDQVTTPTCHSIQNSGPVSISEMRGRTPVKCGESTSYLYAPMTPNDTITVCVDPYCFYEVL